jgi:14-3-3 protein epsilon
MQTATQNQFATLTLFLILPCFIAMAEPNISLDGLSLSEEGLTLNLDADPSTIQILDHCLVGRILTDKQIRFAYFKERLSHFWKPGKKVSILQADNGRFLFQFNHRLDAAKVLDDGPWLFDNYNMVIERIAPSVVPASIDLNHLDLWLQVHNLPFGFIQPKIGQAIGRFLGELKEYDHRNTIHSTFMRLKVRINITNPLQQSWKVRANEGNYVQIMFKYERLGIFCYLCGVLGHTDKVCPKLFDMEQDDGSRGWGENIRPLVRRMGTAATNKYLQDPIPSRPQTVSSPGTNSQAECSHGSTQTAPVPAAGNFDGRIIVVQKEISAIKNGILSAQKQALTKSGKSQNGAGSSSLPLVSLSSPPGFESNNEQPRHVVLGLLAEGQNQPQSEDSMSLTAAESDDTGVDLKKRKRAKAATATQDAEFKTSGVDGMVGPSLGIGINNVMAIHDNPMYDVPNVTTGPEVQACREL